MAIYFLAKIRCPFCDGQGRLLVMVEMKTEKLSFLCDECDSVFASFDSISIQGPASTANGSGWRPASYIEILDEGWGALELGSY